MSTTSTTSTAIRTEVSPRDAGAGPSPRLTTGRVLRSEWIKQRSLRTTWMTLVGIFTSLVAFGLLAAQITTTSRTPGSQGPDFTGTGPVDTVLSGANFAILIVAVLGVIVGAREFSSGMIRSTVAAVPSRTSVLFGKVAAFVGSLTPVVVVGTLLAFFGGTAILSHAGVTSAGWYDAGVARAVLGTIAYLIGLGVIGVSLGMVLRSIAGGVATLIGGLLFVPTLASALLPSSWDAVLKYLPSNAGLSFSSVTSSPDLLSAGAGGLVFAGWVALSLVLAAVVFRRRDV
jgi:ABC-type transport system involved in multi-copper enzyme maturation permease subunit